MLEKVSEHIKIRRKNLDYEIKSRSMREGFEKLPDEVISLIFVNAFRSSKSPDDVNESSISGRTYFSLRISHVSRRFRRIALHTPELWSNISTSLPLSMIPTFLERSGVHDLDVKVDNLSTAERLTEFSTIIIPTRKRWAALDCSLYGGADFVGCLTQNAQTSFPRLQERNHRETGRITSRSQDAFGGSQSTNSIDILSRSQLYVTKRWSIAIDHTELQSLTIRAS